MIIQKNRGRKHQLLSWYIFFIVSGLVMLCISSCKEEEIKMVPVVTTSKITDVGPFSVSCGGNISNDGSSAIIARGVCWSTLPGPTTKDKRTIDGAGTGTFTSIIEGLKSNTIYYVRAYAKNSEGTGYGNEISFTTKGAVPEAITESADKITPFTAQLNTTINPNNLPTEVSFEYGTTPEYGNICLVTKVPFTGGVRTKMYCLVEGLEKNTTYHFRVKAENSMGISYGEDMTFTTRQPDGTIGTVTDIDGNIYKTVVIGSQTWMAENMRTTKLNTGSSLPKVEGWQEWVGNNRPAFCWYWDDEETYKEKYGALYNWYTVKTGKLAPEGWHVPTQEDIETLIRYLGGEHFAGGQLKEAGYINWYSPNTGANNRFGFTGQGSGFRHAEGHFLGLGETGIYWTSTPAGSDEYAVYFALNARSAAIDNIIHFKGSGFSVRCIKD